MKILPSTMHNNFAVGKLKHVIAIIDVCLVLQRMFHPVYAEFKLTSKVFKAFLYSVTP